MRESACGRIISQKKQLIKQYDTCSSTYAIDLLKQKYMRPTPRQQLKQLHNIQVGENVRNAYTKEQNLSQISKLQDLNSFRNKVEQTNSQIDYKLNYIEQEIALIKQQQLLALRSKQSSPLVQLAGSLKVSQIQHSKTHSKQFQVIHPFTIKTINTERSICPLVLHTNETKQFTPQYTFFINKVKDQISLDADFTNIMLSLTQKDRQAVSQFVKNIYGQLAYNFFTVSPLEQDPLLAEPTKSYGTEIEQISIKLYKFYLKIQQHFKSNLAHSHEEKTVQTLFDQIGQPTITLGHLTSYINLRTNCEFRNRNLMKLLKRIGNNSSLIEITKFMQAFTRKV